MEVVWHQAVRQASDRNASLGFAEHIEEGVVIAGSIEEPKLSDTSIQDVKDHASRCDSAAIWHGTSCNQEACQHGARRSVTQEWKPEFPFLSKTTPEVFPSSPKAVARFRFGPR